MRSYSRQTGATLIELVISIVIISVSVTGVMMLITQLGQSSADPMVRTQAASVAEAYLDEIMARALNDPAGGETGGPEAGETRATYDDVSDYNGLNDNGGAFDQYANPVAGLEGYNVSVRVTPGSLGGSPGKYIRVLVTWDGDSDFSLPLSAWRLN